MSFVNGGFSPGVFTADEIVLLHAIFGRIVGEPWMSPEPAAQEGLSRYVIRLYERGMVDPGKLEHLGRMAARKNFSVVEFDVAKQRSLRGRRVMIVEDEYFVAREMSDRLRGEGAEVVGPLGTLEAALHMVNESGAILDAALLDIALREKNVFPVAVALARKGIPFVFVTGYETDIIPAEFRDRKVFTKPSDWSRVSSCLADAAAL